MTPRPRCEAAHRDDSSPCEGPHNAVTILDRDGGACPACVHHGARLLAVLEGGRVHAGTVPGAAIEVYTRARKMTP